MKVTLLTREYPPEVYGGAGVHVEYLARELAALPEVAVEVRRFASPSRGRHRRREDGGPEVFEFEAWDGLGGDSPYESTLRVLSTDLAMASGLEGANVLHSHTWYTNLAGHIGKLLHGIPYVVTSHSLEPLRPWKARLQMRSACPHLRSSRRRGSPVRPGRRQRRRRGWEAGRLEELRGVARRRRCP